MIGTTNANSGTQVFYLGTGTSFDVSNVPGYQNLTVDNFIIDCGKLTVSGSATYCGGCSNSNILVPEYDASTGKLTISNTSISASNGETHNGVWNYGEGFSDKGFTINVSASRVPHVWLCKGKIKQL